MERVKGLRVASAKVCPLAQRKAVKAVSPKQSIFLRGPSHKPTFCDYLPVLLREILSCFHPNLVVFMNSIQPCAAWLLFFDKPSPSIRGCILSLGGSSPAETAMLCLPGGFQPLAVTGGQSVAANSAFHIPRPSPG